jgi:hypothetical protein
LCIIVTDNLLQTSYLLVGQLNVDINTALPVYRFWSDQMQGHFYTASNQEKENIIATWPDIWSFEGVAYYVE